MIKEPSLVCFKWIKINKIEGYLKKNLEQKTSFKLKYLNVKIKKNTKKTNFIQIISNQYLILPLKYTNILFKLFIIFIISIKVNNIQVIFEK